MILFEKKYALDEIDIVAQRIVDVSLTKLYFFQGNLGAGKTTLIKQVGKLLGVRDIMSSPSFSIINEYDTATGEKIYHIDLYRIEQESELLHLGLEEMLNDGICFVEWPKYFDYFEFHNPLYISLHTIAEDLNSRYIRLCKLST